MAMNLTLDQDFYVASKVPNNCTMSFAQRRDVHDSYLKLLNSGGYLFIGPHKDPIINKLLLLLECDDLKPDEVDPSLISYPDFETYDYEGEATDEAEIKRQLPQMVCGSKEDLLSYMRYHVKGITQMETFVFNPSQYNVTYFHTERVHLNVGPAPILWILGEVNPRSYNGDTTYFYRNNIPIQVLVQKPQTVVVFPPQFFVAMKCHQKATVVTWSILRRNLKTIQMAIENKNNGQTSQVPFPTLVLDILNHEVKTLPEDLKQYLRTILKSNYDEANVKFNESITKHKINGRPPKIFQDYVTGLCESCKKDLFMHYYVSKGLYYCLDCMEEQISSSMYHYPIKYIYPSWQPFVVLTTQYSDRMKHQGCIKLICANTYVGHVDHGPEMQLTQKQQSPVVVTESIRQKPKPKSKPKPIEVKQTYQNVETEDRKGRLRQKAVIEDTSYQAIKKKSCSREFTQSVNQSINISINQSNNQSREQVKDKDAQIAKEKEQVILKKQQIDAEIMQLEEEVIEQPVLKKKQKIADDWNNSGW